MEEEERRLCSFKEKRKKRVNFLEENKEAFGGI